MQTRREEGLSQWTCAVQTHAVQKLTVKYVMGYWLQPPREVSDSERQHAFSKEPDVYQGSGQGHSGETRRASAQAAPAALRAPSRWGAASGFKACWLGRKGAGAKMTRVGRPCQLKPEEV